MIFKTISPLSAAGMRVTIASQNQTTLAKQSCAEIQHQSLRRKPPGDLGNDCNLALELLTTQEGKRGKTYYVAQQR